MNSGGQGAATRSPCGEGFSAEKRGGLGAAQTVGSPGRGGHRVRGRTADEAAGGFDTLLGDETRRHRLRLRRLRSSPCCLLFRPVRRILALQPILPLSPMAEHILPSSSAEMPCDLALTDFGRRTVKSTLSRDLLRRRRGGATRFLRIPAPPTGCT